MKRHNGLPQEVRAIDPQDSPEYLARQTCHDCGALVPRGSDRPFCLEHSPYVQRLRAEIAARQAPVAASTRHAA